MQHAAPKQHDGSTSTKTVTPMKQFMTTNKKQPTKESSAITSTMTPTSQLVVVAANTDNTNQHVTESAITSANPKARMQARQHPRLLIYIYSTPTSQLVVVDANAVNTSTQKQQLHRQSEESQVTNTTASTITPMHTDCTPELVVVTTNNTTTEKRNDTTPTTNSTSEPDQSDDEPDITQFAMTKGQRHPLFECIPFGRDAISRRGVPLDRTIDTCDTFM